MSWANFAEPEADLIESARQGDERARAAIVRALERPVYNLALRMLPTPADAEDAAQEALLKIIDGLEGFHGDSRLSTWAFCVAARTCLDHRRGAARRPRLTAAEFQADLLDGLDEAAPERPDDRVALAELKVRCGRALLQCLDAEHRLAYVLGEIAELSGPAAAAAAGVSEPTLRKRLSRARARVQAALSGACGLIDPAARCRCHRRLGRARALGRVPAEPLDAGGDVAALRALLLEIEDLPARVGAFYRYDPAVDLPRAVRERLPVTLSA